jgi:hypothetical protein
MSYNQWTECVNRNKYSGAPWGNGAATAVFAATLYISLSTLITQTISWTPAVIAVLIGLLSFLIVYCEWWLYGRLICLGGDRCAIGLLISVEPPENKSGFDALDTDYSINLLLAPNQIGDNQATIENDGIQGELIKQKHPETSGLDFEAETATGPSDAETAVLHAEFEGAGIYDFYIACLVALGFAIAAGVAAIICALGIPIVSWIACIIAIILAIISLAIALIGLAIGFGDTASPTDVNEDLATLHPEKDILIVKGEWIYDSAHGGWNEIHPIRHAQRIAEWNGSWPFDINQALKEWCDAVGAASSPLTVGNQKKPQQQWRIHPLIDGCKPDDDDDEEEVPILK